jgi:RNA-binding protein
MRANASRRDAVTGGGEHGYNDLVTTPISGRAARHLRALGHDLAPVVLVGKEGITEGLIAATSAALLTHELIKVKVQSEAPVDRKDAAVELAERTGSALAQVLGRTFLLYKRHPKKPRIVLPGPGAGRR